MGHKGDAPGRLGRLMAFTRACRASQTGVVGSCLKSAAYRLRGRELWVHPHVRIHGWRNMVTGGLVRIGVDPVGFMAGSEPTVLNVKGRLEFRSWFSVGRGCRLDIGEEAVCSFGWGYVNALSTFVIGKGLRVGDHCAIAWDCHFLDTTFHRLHYEGKTARDDGIEIGDHVWIGCNVTVLGGARIPSNAVVAAGAVVTRAFEEEGVLIGGNPARVLRRGIRWTGQ